jgi:threonine/homoserine/homoserine lactone efflux protein
MLLVIGHAMSNGPRKSLATVAGIVFADACLLCLALAGVGAVIYSSAIAFTVMKWAGAIYLIYLGIRQWRAASTGEKTSNGNEGDSIGRGRSAGRSFVVGFVTTMLNPKIIGFFVAFFPQFIASTSSWLVQLLIMGATFLFIVFTIMAAYAVLAGVVRETFRKPGVRRALDRISGATLVGAGLMTATLKRS